MPTLMKFEKQPGEVQDFDIDFSEWLESQGETVGAAHTHTVTAATGITKNSSSLASGVVKVWLSGGTTGTNYKVTAVLTTAGGRTKEAEITIKVKEV